MRSRRFFLFLSTLVLVLTLLSRAQSTDEQQIRSDEDALAPAEGRTDFAPLKKILAEDWVTPECRVLHKEDLAQNNIGHEGEVKPYVVKLSDLRIDVFGDTAVTTFVREYHGRTGEAQGKVARESVVDVFTKQGGQWKLHYGKATPLPCVTSNEM